MASKYGFASCPDGHHCDNGSLCTKNPNNEGSYYCDCKESFINDTVAGLSCEHVATEYCTFNKQISSVSFCTNHGTCKVEVSPESAHLGCNCPEEYMGDHCEFVRGTNLPKDWPTIHYTTDLSRGDDKVKGGVTAVIVLICLGFVGVLAYFVYMKRKTSTTGGAHELSSPELELDADGTVLNEAMSSTSGSGRLGSAEFELDADGDVLKEAVSPSPKAANLDDINVSSPENGTEDSGNDLV